MTAMQGDNYSSHTIKKTSFLSKFDIVANLLQANVDDRLISVVNFVLAGQVSIATAGLIIKYYVLTRALSSKFV